MEDTNAKITQVSSLRALAEQLNNRIKAQISATYHPGGSVDFANLPELAEGSLGMVVNVKDAFAATADFVEGAGKTYPAGTNVAIVKVGEAYKYDAMSGMIDLSGFVQAENGRGLSANDYTDADKDKLDGIAADATKVEVSDTPGCIRINGADVRVVAIATDDEVNAMLADVFGTAGV